MSALELKVLERLPGELEQLAIGGRDDVRANWAFVVAALVLVVTVVNGVYFACWAECPLHQPVVAEKPGVQDTGDQPADDQRDVEADNDRADDGSPPRHYHVRVLAERLESLTAGASVSELVELRAELMMQGRLP